MGTGNSKMASPEAQPEWIKDVIMFLAFIGTMFGLQYKASKAHRERMETLEADIKAAEASTAAALKATAEADLKLTQCRLGVEEKYASKSYLQDVEERIVKALDEMKAEFRAFRDRGRK